jgi:WD40 repeat protein/energy-coupling factor transporter ATP-binding protein EcfA2
MTVSEGSVPTTTPSQEDEWPKFPYPGLRPFKESEAVIFYGRNAQKDSVLERLNENRMVFITGPSGCGKSSLIKAGVMPALRAGLLTRAGYRWKTTGMRPGRRPLINLSIAFEQAFRASSSKIKPDKSDLLAYLERDEAGLWAIMSMMVDHAENTSGTGDPVLLLLVDQFEEIFGPQIAHRSEVDAFVKLLVTQFARPHLSLYVVFTIRSDYVGKCASFPGLADIINHCQYLTPVLTTKELREAIVLPAEDYGAHVSDDLVTEILADMHAGTAYDPDNLPLMQHALLWLWQRATGFGSPATTRLEPTPAVTLDADEYRKLGRLRGILNLHADAILSEAVGQNGERDAIAEVVFRRLAERDSDGRYRRSPAPVEEVREIASCGEAELDQVIAPFADAKASFLEIRKSGSTDEPLLDISHEALIRTWDRARDWADGEAEKLATFCELMRSAEVWRTEGENPSCLKRRRELELFEKFWSRSNPTVSWAKRYFNQEGRAGGAEAVIGLVARYLDASIEADRSEKLRQERLEKERVRNKLIAAGSVVASVLSLVGLFFWTTWRETEQAKAQLLVERAKNIAMRAQVALEYEGPSKAILIAMEAQKHALPDLPETEKVIFESLLKPLEKRIISAPGGAVMGFAYSPNGQAIVGVDSKSLHFWNPDDGSEIDTYPLEASTIAVSFGRIQWSPTGEWLAIGSQDKTLLLAPCSHPRLKPLFSSCAGKDQDKQELIGDPEHRAGLAKFSGDGRWIVTSTFGGPLMRWDIADRNGTTAKKTSLNVAPLLPNAFAISPDMKIVAAGLLNGEIRLIDPDSGSLQATLLPPPEEQKDHSTVNALSFNPNDPNMLVASETGGNIFIWDVKNKTPKKLPGAQGMTWQLVFSRDSQFIAAGSDSGVIRTWKTQELANEPSQLRGHRGAAYWVAYSPDEMRLASASITDKTIRIWNPHSPLYPEVAEVTPPGAQPTAPQSSDLPPHWRERISLPNDFGSIAAYAESETGRLVVASKEGRLALFSHAEGWRGPIAEWRSPADITTLKLEHDSERKDNPDRIVTVSSLGLRASWPFFRDVNALINFATSQLPFVEKDRLSLSENELCKIAPPDRCKAEAEQLH